ncbi:hypothetical protein NP493_267g00007 [Ridgeia piscesae]|uniref:Uncharacterized protein n=1 Tax=Ridgeia piscesae TaxID=27915 RepID=A0AAD9NXN2_RIDPI|nr:hypothetical protein NP493_267g00007 [Ridgeia piscesae]
MSQSKEDRALVRLANDMLTQLHVSTRVRHLCDINAGVFLTLFEGLCGEKLPGRDLSLALTSVRDIRSQRKMSQSKEDRALVRLANDMLTQLHVSTRVRHLCDINAGVFLTLFEGLCGEKLPDRRTQQDS